MKNINEVHKLLKNSEFSQKIKIYFVTRSYDANYDSQNNNYTMTYKNPITIKGLIRYIESENAIWKGFGIDSTGGIEIICESKYMDMFENCAKVEFDNKDYLVLRNKTGNNATIIKRPNNLIRISLKAV